MPSPTIQDRDLNELDRLYQTKQTLDKLETVRSEWHQEMKQLSLVDNEELAKYRQALDELNQEKMAHVEELKLINNDINALDTLVKQAEAARAKSVETARRRLGEAVELRERTNALRRSDDAEATLPDALLHHPQLHKLFDVGAVTAAVSSYHQPSMGVGGQPPTPSYFPPLWPTGPSLTPAAIPFGLTINQDRGQNQGANIDQQQRKTDVGDSSRDRYGECSTSGGVSVLSSSAIKQTQPPMKICTSCQQPIHRNAPICPMCKCKSRSKNPKKPKRKPQED